MVGYKGFFQLDGLATQAAAGIATPVVFLSRLRQACSSTMRDCLEAKQIWLVQLRVDNYFPRTVWILRRSSMKAERARSAVSESGMRSR